MLRKYGKKAVDSASEQIDKDFFESARLLICRYVPERLLPADLMDSAIDDFLRLYAVALKSRELQQEDMKQAVMAAISELFGN